jgi:hypothetical protein
MESKTAVNKYNINRLTTNSKTTSSFALFEAYDWISNNPTVLPTGKLIPDSIPKTIQVLTGRIHNRRGLRELLSTDSFTLTKSISFYKQFIHLLE